MADLNVELIAAKLGKSLQDAADRVQAEVNQAIADLANAAYANIIAHVQASSMSDDNRRNYLKSLKFDQIGENSYVIYLDGQWPTMLEAGFPGYDMKEKMLSSNKVVGVGSRAGQPWVKKNKDGKKYAAVPFERRPSAPSSGDLGTTLKEVYARNRKGKEQKITSVFKDEFGKPIAGKVAIASGLKDGGNLPDNMKGLTKYQSVNKKGKVSSVYMTFRIVHEESNGWRHPGFDGYQFFDKVEKELEAEISNIINTLL
jgi:hypothetical protein